MKRSTVVEVNRSYKANIICLVEMKIRTPNQTIWKIDGF